MLELAGALKSNLGFFKKEMAKPASSPDGLGVTALAAGSVGDGPGFFPKHMSYCRER